MRRFDLDACSLQLMPDEPEAFGLLSLMVLHNARRRSRVDEAGELISLEDQNRSLWDKEAIRGRMQPPRQGDPAGPNRPLPTARSHRRLPCNRANRR